MGSGFMVAQNTIAVQGVVTSEDDGQPVIGASVMVVGTNLGAITDLDGKFSIANVPTSAKTLQVSYIGMATQEVPIKQGTIKVVLKSDSQILEDVIVVAYGNSTKSSFTGSAGTVKADQISKVQTSNVTSALTGRVAGVQTNTTTGQPGASNPKIRVRGISSINAGNNPLIIMDGIPYDGDLNNISSQDIESMTVLKDAASNALYGARGANGVIMITTKKGNKAQGKVEVDAKWGSNSRATQDYNFITSPAQYYEMYYGALKSYYKNVQSYSDLNAHIAANNNMITNSSNGLGYNIYTVPDGEFLIGANGRLNPSATLGRKAVYDGNTYWLQPDNWLDAAYKTSLRQEYNVSVSSGSDKSTFYASFNYLDNKGIIDKTGFTRLTGRLKADSQVKDWLKVGANFAYVHYNSDKTDEDGTSNSSGNLLAISTQIAPIYPLYIRDGQGNIMYDGDGIKRYDYGDGKNAGLSRPIFTASNALSQNRLDTQNSEGNALSAVGFFEIRFLKDFKFTSTNSVYVDEVRDTNITNPYYGQYAADNGSVYKYHRRELMYNYQQLLNYTRRFGEHSIDVMVGHEAYRYKYYYLAGNKKNFLLPDNPELAGGILDGPTTSYTTDYNTEGYFGRAQYDYSEKYFGSVSYRRDASSRFHPDHRWGNFWSLSGAWMLSKESWLTDVSWLNELKFKASYGSQGNDDIGNYRYTNIYTIKPSSGIPIPLPSSMGNKNITWETNANFNTGIEFGLFKDRLKGSIEYFYRKTTDMLFSFPVPPTNGFTSFYANVGDMRNSGVEIDLSGVILKTNDLEWDVNLNITSYKNKVTRLPEDRRSMKVDGKYGYTGNGYFYGQDVPLYTFYTKRFAGLNENGESLYYMNVNKKDASGNEIKGEDGFPIVDKVETTSNYENASYYLCGTALPDAYGGFGTGFKFKGFDFSMDFAYQLGGLVYDSDYALMMRSPISGSRGSAFHADLLNAWTPEHHTNIPRMQFGDQYTSSSSDRFLTSASYLSLQNITLGYTFPTRWCRTIGLEKLRIYGTADNVWLWSKRQGLDPRQNIDGTVTNSYYAPIRTISGGITLTF
jgi:TonB-linked SusC/RagA family outer membrane protein